MSTFVRHAVNTTLALSMMGTACFGQLYNQTDLVSNTSGVAPVTDPDLINPWGMSRGSGSPWWVSDNGTGLATLYNGAGAKQSLVVKIPAAVSGQQGTQPAPSLTAARQIFCSARATPRSFCLPRSMERSPVIQPWE